MINTYRDLLKLKIENTIDNLKPTKESFLEESDQIKRELLIDLSKDYFIQEGLVDKTIDKVFELKETFLIDKAVKNLTKKFTSSIEKTYDYFYKNTIKNSNDKSIKDNAALLTNYSNTIELQNKINYHDYRNLDMDIPPAIIISNFIREYSNSFIELKRIASDKNGDSSTLLFDKLTELTKKTDDSINGFNYSYIRGIKEEIIRVTKDGTISSPDDEDINSLATKLFTGNEGFDSVDITSISGDMVQRSYSRYCNINKYLRSIESTKKAILKANDRVIQEFKNNKKELKNLCYNKQTSIALFKYCKAKYLQLNMVYQTMWNLYYTRLVLIYASSIKDRQICLKAIEWSKYNNLKVYESTDELKEYIDTKYEEVEKDKLTPDEEDYWEEHLKIDQDEYIIQEIYDQLQYDNYIVFKEYQDTLLDLTIKSKVLNEAIDMKAVNNTVTNFLKNIVANIQKAWNNFLASTQDFIWDKIKNQYANELKMDRPMTMTKIDKNKDFLPNTGKITEFIAIPNGQDRVNAEYSQEGNNEGENNKETEAILQHYDYFKGINLQKSDTVSAMKAHVNKECFFVPEENSKINLAVIENYSKFLDEYKNNVNKIQEDIKNANDRIKDFESMNAQMKADTAKANEINNKASNNEQQQKESFINDISNSLIESYITEMEMKDEQNPDGKSGNPAKLKFIKNYFRIYNTVLSLKMSTLNKGKNICASKIIKYCRNARKNG